MPPQQPPGPRMMKPDNVEAKREFDRLWMDHQRKRESGHQQQQHQQQQQQTVQPLFCPQPIFVDATRPPFSQDPGLVGSGGGGPPVLVVPPNNACGYPPPPSNRFATPTSSFLKRPYAGGMKPSDVYESPPEFWGPPDIMEMVGGFPAAPAQAIPAHLQTPPVPTTTTTGGRPSRNGLSKKRKSTAAAAANRAAAAVAAALNSTTSQLVGCNSNTMSVAASGRVGAPPPLYSTGIPLQQRLMAGGKPVLEQHRQQHQQASIGGSVVFPMGQPQHSQPRGPYPMPSEQGTFPVSVSVNM